MSQLKKYLLILIESTFIYGSISEIDGFELLGLFPAILFLIFASSKNLKIVLISVLLGIITSIPRLILIDQKISRHMTTAKAEQKLAPMELIKCDSIPNYNPEYNGCIKNLNKAIEYNQSIQILVNKTNIDQIHETKRDLLHYSFLLLYIAISLSIPTSIYLIELEEKLSNPIPEKSDKEKIMELFSRGLKPMEISKQLGFSKSKVYDILKDAEMKTNE